MNVRVQEIPRPEHPRPDFQRESFVNLNGKWHFDFDDKDEGLREGWYLVDDSVKQSSQKGGRKATGNPIQWK